MAAVKTSQMIYDQQSSEKSGTSASSPDDIDSKANELKEMANVEKMLSDELSKVDAQEKGLSVITGSVSANATSDFVGSMGSVSEDKNGRLASSRNTKDESSPASVRFSDSSVAENGRIKSGGSKEKKKDKKEEQPLLSAASMDDSVKISVEEEDTNSVKT